MNRLFSYFSKKEWGLWTVSVGMLFASYLLFEEKNPATLLVSILGVSSLLFCAKGHPIGQLLMVLFGSPERSGRCYSGNHFEPFILKYLYYPAGTLLFFLCKIKYFRTVLGANINSLSVELRRVMNLHKEFQ